MQVLIRYHSDIENIIFQGSALFQAQILETFIIRGWISQGKTHLNAKGFLFTPAAGFPSQLFAPKVVP